MSKEGKVLKRNILDHCIDDDERVTIFQKAIKAGDTLWLPYEDKDLPELLVEFEKFGEEMSCIPSYLDSNAVIFDSKKCMIEKVSVEALIQTLLLSDKRDAIFVGDSCGRGTVITKAIAQRIFEPFLGIEDYRMNDNKRLAQAVKYATAMHKDQFRKGSMTPYIVHPLEVMTILRAMDADVNLLIAGLLHDVVEEADVSIADIEQRFGMDVAFLVAAHTENKKWSWEIRKQFSIDETKCGSNRIKMLVLADSVANQRAMLLDYNDFGDKVWERFEKGKEKQAWYYNQKQDVLFSLKDGNNTKRIYWEMVNDYKDIFVDYFLNVTEQKIFQVSPVESYVFEFDRGRWELIQEENKEIKGVQISRTFAETIEDAWKLNPEEKRQWKEWMFNDAGDLPTEQVVRRIMKQLKEMDLLKYREETTI